MHDQKPSLLFISIPINIYPTTPPSPPNTPLHPTSHLHPPPFLHSTLHNHSRDYRLTIILPRFSISRLFTESFNPPQLSYVWTFHCRNEQCRRYSALL